MVQPTFQSSEESEVLTRRRVPKWTSQGAERNIPAERQQIRSIGQAFEVLNSFDGHTPLSLMDLTTRVDLPKSTLYRLLLNLEKSNFLQREMDGTYQLTPRLLLGWQADVANRLRDRVRPELERLARRFNETVSLGYLFEDRIHVLDSVEGFHDFRITNTIGRMLPPHCSALGKAITAHQEPALAEQVLEVYGFAARTERTIIDRRKLFEEFEEIRMSGLACDREESMSGGVGFAAALRADGQRVVAAIGVSVPALRVSAERETEIRSCVSAAVQSMVSDLRVGR